MLHGGLLDDDNAEDPLEDTIGKESKEFEESVGGLQPVGALQADSDEAVIQETSAVSAALTGALQAGSDGVEADAPTTGATLALIDSSDKPPNSPCSHLAMSPPLPIGAPSPPPPLPRGALRRWAKKSKSPLPTARTRLATSGPQPAACSQHASCPVMQLRLSWLQDVHGLNLATLSAFRDFDTSVGAPVCLEDELNILSRLAP